MTSEKTWRRRWKPDLASKSWRPLQIADKNILVKTLFTDQNYQILITDLKLIWLENATENILRKRSKALNPNVEAPLSKVLDHIREYIEEKEGAEFTLNFTETDDGDCMRLTMNTKLAGLPFTWTFKGKIADNHVVSEHLVVPMVSMSGEFSRQQSELFKLLRQKDKEIADLKAQGVKSSRKHLETVPFDETVFQDNMYTSKGFEELVIKLGVPEFGETSQSMYTNIMMKLAYINRETDSDEDTDAKEDGESWTNRVPPSLASRGGPSPSVSPKKSPAVSPVKGSPQKMDDSPAKDSEALRRQALERRLQQEEEKKEQAQKKKKKKFKI